MFSKRATIDVNLSSEKLLQILLRALVPETKSAASRARVSIHGKGKRLTMSIQAEDATALRATLNSYLRWVSLVSDVFDTLVDFQKHGAKTLN